MEARHHAVLRAFATLCYQHFLFAVTFFFVDFAQHGVTEKLTLWLRNVVSNKNNNI